MVYKLLSGYHYSSWSGYCVSITKRCTDCFRKRELGSLKMCNGFNHQTVYRLLYCYIIDYLKNLLVSITKRCTDCFYLDNCIIPRLRKFQSPNGVQIAFWLSYKKRLGFFCFNHQTVYRLLLDYIKETFIGKEGFNHQTVYRLL